jgi:CheY-like chemotaxis protein
VPVVRASKRPKPPPVPADQGFPTFPKRPASGLEMPPLPIIGGYADPRDDGTADRADPKPAAGPAPTPVSTLDTKGAHSILVVEDDEATRRLMVRALRTAYTVYEASNGEEAATMLDRHPNVDCVISDIMMPKLTGTGLAQKMKTDARLAKIPVVFVTAKKVVGEVVEGVKLNARYFLRKPFKLKELLDRVASVIEKPW